MRYTCPMAIEEVEQRMRLALETFVSHGGKVVTNHYGADVSTTDYDHDKAEFFPEDGYAPKCCAIAAWAVVDQPPPGWWEDEPEDEEFDDSPRVRPQEDTEQATENAAQYVFGWSVDEHTAFVSAFDGATKDEDLEAHKDIVELAHRLARDFNADHDEPG